LDNPVIPNPHDLQRQTLNVHHCAQCIALWSVGNGKAVISENLSQLE
jgi:hypothetical protein